MAEWIECSIGDLCSTISDTYKGNDEYVVLVNTSDVLEGKVLNHETVANKNLKGQFKKTFKRYDILYSEIRPANKRFAYIDFENTSNYIASTKLMVLRHNEKVLPEYLFALLKSNYVIAELQHLAETRSGTFPQITFSSELAPMKVFLPDKDTQIRIVSILSSIEQKIDKNNEINNNLLQQAQALYREMFVNTTNDQRRTCRAEEYFDIAIGKTPPRKEHQWFTTNPSDVTWVSISDMGGCGTYISRSSEQLTQAAVDKFNIKVVPSNTVLLSFKLTVGRIAITHGEMTTNEAIAHFKIDKPFINEYLYCYLRDFNYQTMGSTSSIAIAVNSKIIKAMPFVIPADDEISRFHSVVGPMFEQILNNQLENDSLADLRDTLLPKLMSGELDVSNLDL